MHFQAAHHTHQLISLHSCHGIFSNIPLKTSMTLHTVPFRLFSPWCWYKLLYLHQTVPLQAIRNDVCHIHKQYPESCTDMPYQNPAVLLILTKVISPDISPADSYSIHQLLQSSFPQNNGYYQLHFLCCPFPAQKMFLTYSMPMSCQNVAAGWSSSLMYHYPINPLLTEFYQHNNKVYLQFLYKILSLSKWLFDSSVHSPDIAILL